MRSPELDTFVSLLQTVFNSILEVFLLCCAGYTLAIFGILDKKTQKQINRLNVSLFTPSLLFSKVAFFLSPAKLKELWIIPIFFVVVTVLSMAVSFALGWAFKLKRSQRNFAMAAAMFMNSNSLPIALMQSLVVTVPGLKWGDDDNKDAMVGRALTYLVLYSTLGMILRWSYGVRLLAQADPEPVSLVTPLEVEDENETSLLLSGSEATIPPIDGRQQKQQQKTRISSSAPLKGDDSSEHSNGYLPAIVVDSEHADTNKLHLSRTHKHIFHSFPNSPNQSRANLLGLSEPSQQSPTGSSRTQTFAGTEASASDSEEDSEEDDRVIPRHHHHHVVPTNTHFQSLLRRGRYRLLRGWRTFNEFMTVPLWAAILSLIVACVQPLQHALEQHMRPVKGALSQAGNCSIPLTLVVLGAYFYTPKESGAEGAVGAIVGGGRGRGLTTVRSSGSLFDSVREIFKLKTHWSHRRTRSSRSVSSMSSQQKPESGRRGETKTVIIAILSRMIIVPMLLMPLMAISTWYDWHAVFADPVFVVANVLLISSPPALTLAQITQAAASGDAFERLISRTIFWSYCVVTPPATIVYVVIGMLLSKL